MRGATSDARESIKAAASIALFSAALAILLLVGLVAARGNLPGDMAALGISFCVALWPLLGPAALRRMRIEPVDLADGALTVFLLLVPFALLLLGIAGEIIVVSGAAFFLIACLISVQVPSLWRALGWTALLLAAALLLVIQIGGTKYLNFFADQLALFGRTDGDIFGHGAITNSLRYFGEPSMGIDGIQRLNYHFEVNLFSASIGQAFNLDATYALILVKVLVLVPLLVRTAASAGLSVMVSLSVRARWDALPVVGWTVALVGLLPLADIGNITSVSESMLLGGILLLCATPSLVRYWIGEQGAGPAHWLFWLAMIPLIAVSKISAGSIWFGLVGYTALRRIGPRRAAFWLIAAAAMLLFLAFLRLVSDPAEMGADWFGEPYFVERGFKEGDYLLPARELIEWLLAFAGCWILRPMIGTAERRRLLEFLAIVGLGANLPGLLMHIPGGNAYYFITVANWIALPIVIVACTALWRTYASRGARGAIAAGVLGVLVLLVVASVSPVKLGLRHFIAANALIRTGDLSYYDDDTKRPVREDAERAWKELDHELLLRGAAAAAPAQSLIDKLTELRLEYGPSIALYVPPEVDDYWNYVRDCDLSSPFPMAMAGVQAIDGYYPDQSACPQEIGIRGYHDVPMRRTSKDDAALCALARERSVSVVYVVRSLQDRARDQLLRCEPVAPAN